MPSRAGISPAAIAAARRQVALMYTPVLPGIRVFPAAIPRVKAEWHIDRDADEERRIVYFHGGGYIFGTPTGHRLFTSMLSRLSGCAVLSVDYRLAPEHPFPAAFDDAVAALRWAKMNGPQGPAPATSLVSGGDSAGGGLSLAAAMEVLREHGLRLDAQVLISPWTDHTHTLPSLRELEDRDPLLSLDQGIYWSLAYRAGASQLDPRISPLYGDFAGLGPQLYVVGGCEILLDDGMRAFGAAQDAGVEAELIFEDELFHIWPVFYHVLPEARQTTRAIAHWLRARMDAAAAERRAG